MLAGMGAAYAVLIATKCWREKAGASYDVPAQKGKRTMDMYEITVVFGTPKEEKKDDRKGT